MWLWLLTLVSLMGVPFVVLMSIYTKEVLMGGADTYGYLMGAVGVGALIGALYLASRKNAMGLMRVVAVSCGIFAVGLVGMSLSRNSLVSLFFTSDYDSLYRYTLPPAVTIHISDLDPS